MDRKIIYPGQVPLETDLLGTNRNTMIALGRFALDILGSSTLVSGLACTATSPASMTVKIGAGAIYSVQNVDNSAYSSLEADTTNQILKQGIVLASDALTLTMTAPVTSGYSVIYLIQAAYSEVDTDSIILPYYNPSNPAVPYSGPNNTGASSATTRAGNINITAKAGVAAASPSAPTPDSGFVPLYYVTIAYGQTSITGANIAVATGAPFIPATLGGLTAYAPIDSPTFTGTPLAPTPGGSDNSTKIATTAFVRGLFGSSFGSSWYQRLPSGLIIQGANVAVTGGSNTTTTAVTFPIAFPTACLSVTGNQTANASGSWFPLVIGALSPGTTGFTLRADVANPSVNISAGVTANYIAIGY